MAVINYTGSITLRETKGSALNFEELDTNFIYLNSGSIGGTYSLYENVIPPLLTTNGDGFGNILVGEVSPSLTAGITSSQLVTLDTSSPSNKLYFTTSSINNSGSFIGVALETKTVGQEIKVLTEGYYSVYSSASATPGYLKDSTTSAGLPVYFSGSYVTLVKPSTAITTRPLGFTLSTEVNPNQIKYIKFSPSPFTLA